MFRWPSAALLTITALLLAACSIPSIHPFHTPESLLCDSSLAGCWAMEDVDGKPIILMVTGEGPQHHAAVVFTDQNDELASMIFQASTFRVENATYADLTLADSQVEELRSRYLLFAMPVYQVIRYERVGDSLHVWQLNPQRMQERLAGLGIPSVENGQVDRVLTGTPEQLQEFLKAHTHDEDIWSDPITFVRLSPTP